MKDKIEIVSKTIPALTFASYVCGFVIYNTHLSHFGIVDIEIFNLKYLVAGINFLFFLALILGTVYIWPLESYEKRWRKYFIISVNVILALTFYIVFFYSPNTTFETIPSFALVIIITILFDIFFEQAKTQKAYFTDAPLWIITLVIGSLFLFGLSFRHIKKTLGGGQLYREILILEKPINGFIKLDENLKTDTLYIIHENDKEIFFYNNDKVCSVKKELVLGKIVIND